MLTRIRLFSIFESPIIHSVASQIWYVIDLNCSWENVVLPGAFENNGLECIVGIRK